MCVCASNLSIFESPCGFTERGRFFVVLSYVRPDHDEQCASISLRCPVELFFSVCVLLDFNDGSTRKSRTFINEIDRNSK